MDPKRLAITAHDDPQPEASGRVDRGLDEANHAAAPLHEVQPLSCFAWSETGEVIGGAVGRRWGAACELQQLWVAPAHRCHGVGSALVRAFEARARTHGCSAFFLETFSFQTPALYESLGYEVAFEHALYPHGIVKFIMVKREQAARPAG